MTAAIEKEIEIIQKWIQEDVSEGLYMGWDEDEDSVWIAFDDPDSNDDSMHTEETLYIDIEDYSPEEWIDFARGWMEENYLGVFIKC